MKPVFFIPIRSGSKGLPNKNILMLGGKPLVHYSIDAVIEAGFAESDIYVSSDSREYLNVAGFNHDNLHLIERDDFLSSDLATTFDVLKDFLVSFDDDQIFVLLQATSPFKAGNEIIKAIQLLESTRAHSVVGFSEMTEPTSLITKIDEDGFVSELDKVDQGYRRQKFERQYIPNGTLFVSTKRNYLEYGGFFSKSTRPLVMSPESIVDIDSEIDFKTAVGVALFKKDVNKSEKKLSEELHKLFFENEDESDDKLVLLGDSRFVEFKNSNVLNLSVNGMTLSAAKQAVMDISNNLIEGKKFLITLGVNDIKFDKSDDFIFSEYVELIDKLHEKNVSEVMVTPVLEAFGRIDVSNEKIKELNKQIQKMDGVKFLDILMDVALESVTDGLHFTKQFQEKLYLHLKEKMHLEDVKA